LDLAENGGEGLNVGKGLKNEDRRVGRRINLPK